MAEAHEEYISAATDWPARYAAQAYANGYPAVSGQIKFYPEDFVVTEVMDVVPSGQGEHDWLQITKVRCNTEQVARGLARFAEVSPRDVGYSGMKDFQAVTTQWFSIWRPRGGLLDWQAFEMKGVTVRAVTKHNRKIKRGTHRANQFEIAVRELQGDTDDVITRLNRINRQGVPNYFGTQRFGRNGNNMRQAYDWLLESKQIRRRNLQGILLSSARSWLFNQVVSRRVSSGTWRQLYAGEPANLDGTGSVFNVDQSARSEQRLAQLDIHATAPMVGQGGDDLMRHCPQLQAQELMWLAAYQPLIDALQRQGLTYQRRAVRAVARDLRWVINGERLSLWFELQRGQFATSVLRELIKYSEFKQ